MQLHQPAYSTWMWLLSRHIDRRGDPPAQPQGARGALSDRQNTPHRTQLGRGRSHRCSSIRITRRSTWRGRRMHMYVGTCGAPWECVESAGAAETLPMAHADADARSCSAHTDLSPSRPSDGDGPFPADRAGYGAPRRRHAHIFCTACPILRAQRKRRRLPPAARHSPIRRMASASTSTCSGKAQPEPRRGCK